MRTLGIIAEYNPFHNGHKLHLQTSKRELGADYCVVVMSGNFVQRGEPAIIHKWKRAEMCLLGGADLVIELPVHYATASAEYFARGAVTLLERTGIIDYLSFGAESVTLSDFNKTLDYIMNEPPEYKLLLRNALSEGESFPKARATALAELVSVSPDIYGTPNNILAIEYLKALKTLNSQIIPYAMKREYSEHNSDKLEAPYASASAIRKAVFGGTLSDILPFIPAETHQVLENSSMFFPVNPESFSDMLIYKIKSLDTEQLNRFADVSEGLENRIADASANDTLKEIISQIKTKRYTFTKIQRCLTHILLGITSDDMDTFEQNGGPSYIRVLGFRKAAEPLLSRLTERASLPVVTNISKQMQKLDSISRKMLQDEIRATDVYFIKCSEQALRRKGIEYAFPIVIV